MKKVAKLITTVIVLLFILVFLDKFSLRSNTSLFLPQNGETRYFISKLVAPPPSNKIIERTYKEKVTLLNKNPTKISSIKDNGKKYFLNNGKWLKITTYSNLYPPPYYIFENKDFLINFQQNSDDEYEPFIELKFRDNIGDSWDVSKEVNMKAKEILVSKNATVKTPSQTYVHCIETKIFGKGFAIYSYYAPSDYLVKSEIKNTKSNKIVSSSYLSRKIY
jgi:hypothetical protein